MGTEWKWLNIFFELLLIQLCYGIPISLEESVTDKHAQLLTGLVAVLLAVCSIIFVVGCLCCHRKNGFQEFRDSPVVASVASNLDHGHVNPIANGEFTIFSPLSLPYHNNNIFLAKEQIITRTSEDYVYGDVDVSSWFCGSEKDFPRIKLKYIKELGKGWFGKVVEGAAKDLENESDSAWTSVVVRILDATASHRERVMFLNDAAIYRCGSHPHILSLFGRCLDTVPLLLLQEYCLQGDLKGYLKTKADNPDGLFFTDYPLRWCYQLTSALKHLHDNKIVHPDLATRNCQLASDLALKLGDYGLSTTKYPEDYYQGSPAIPVRWRSPESLNCTLTTIQSKKITPEDNVWSLGVTVWEIYTCGEQPYSALSDDEVVSQVLGPPNVRLTRPTSSNRNVDYMYQLMQLCWTQVTSRPTASQVQSMLTDLLEAHNAKENQFEERWESLKQNTVVKVDFISKAAEGDLERRIDSNNLENSADSSENLANKLGGNGNFSDVRLADEDSFLEISSVDVQNQVVPKFETFSSSPNINFDFTKYDQYCNDFSETAASQRTSSESDTEDESWKKKVERGAYTEKVRLKSKSAADLMVLTHIDYSESESETPLPSLDYRVNYKNGRRAAKRNLENPSLAYGSEGNLLNVEDAFQDELRKLHGEYKDNLVPDSRSQSSSSKLSSNRDALVLQSLTASDPSLNRNTAADPSSKRLMLELNNMADIKPAQQIFNVFNVTIDKIKPIGVNTRVLGEFISVDEGNAPRTQDENSSEESNVAENLLQQTCADESSNIKHISHIENEKWPNNTFISSSPDTVNTVDLSCNSNEEIQVVTREDSSELIKTVYSSSNENLYYKHIEPKEETSTVTPANDNIQNRDVELAAHTSQFKGREQYESHLLPDNMDTTLETEGGRKNIDCGKSEVITLGENNAVIENETSDFANKAEVPVDSYSLAVSVHDTEGEHKKHDCQKSEVITLDKNNLASVNETNDFANRPEVPVESLSLCGAETTAEMRLEPEEEHKHGEHIKNEVITLDEDNAATENETNLFTGEEEVVVESHSLCDNSNTPTEVILETESEYKYTDSVKSEIMTVDRNNLAFENETSNFNTRPEVPVEFLSLCDAEAKAETRLEPENEHKHGECIKNEVITCDEDNAATENETNLFTGEEEVLVESHSPCDNSNTTTEVILETESGHKNTDCVKSEVMALDRNNLAFENKISYFDNKQEVPVESHSPCDNINATTDSLEPENERKSTECEKSEVIKCDENNLTTENGINYFVKHHVPVESHSPYDNMSSAAEMTLETEIERKSTDPVKSEVITLDENDVVTENETNDLAKKDEVPGASHSVGDDVTITTETTIETESEHRNAGCVKSEVIRCNENNIGTGNETSNFTAEQDVATESHSQCDNTNASSEMMLETESEHKHTDCEESKVIALKENNEVENEINDFRVEQEVPVVSNLLCENVAEMMLETENEAKNTDCKKSAVSTLYKNNLTSENKTSDFTNKEVSVESYSLCEKTNTTAEMTVATENEAKNTHCVKREVNTLDKKIIATENETVNYDNKQDVPVESNLLYEKANITTEMTPATENEPKHTDCIRSVDITLDKNNLASENETSDFANKEASVESYSLCENANTIAEMTVATENEPKNTHCVKSEVNALDKKIIATETETVNYDNKQDVPVESNLLYEKANTTIEMTPATENEPKHTDCVKSEVITLDKNNLASENETSDFANKEASVESYSLCENTNATAEMTVATENEPKNTHYVKSEVNTLDKKIIAPETATVNFDNKQEVLVESNLLYEKANITTEMTPVTENEPKNTDCVKSEVIRHYANNVVTGNQTNDFIAEEKVLVTTSTPTSSPKKQSLPLLSENTSTLDIQNWPREDQNETTTETSSISLLKNPSDTEKLNYSLETWDTFLGKTLDDQNKVLNETYTFDSFPSDSYNSVFVENDKAERNQPVFDVKSGDDGVYELQNETFIINDNANATFTIDGDEAQPEEGDVSHELEISEDDVHESGNGDWAGEGGWFLHPQVNETVKFTTTSAPSYVGFGMDEDIMTAIRNELLIKLPHAQGTPTEKVVDLEDWDTQERNEIFLKYNIYNPPLSPILEESYNEELSSIITPKQESESEDSEWSECCILKTLAPEEENQSSPSNESLPKDPDYLCTPSQGSCCSNDTLFNLEEISCGVTEHEKDVDVILRSEELNRSLKQKSAKDDDGLNATGSVNSRTDDNTECLYVDTDQTKNGRNEKKSKALQLTPLSEIKISEGVDCQLKPNQDDIEENQNKVTTVSLLGANKLVNTHYISKFIYHERDHSSRCIIIIDTPPKPNMSQDNPVAFVKVHVAPLPSPEDNPWKQLPASLLSYDMVISQNNASVISVSSKKSPPAIRDVPKTSDIYESHFEERCSDYENDLDYVNCKPSGGKIKEIYDTVDSAGDRYNEADYVNIINLENAKNRTEYVNLKEREEHDYINIDKVEGKFIGNEEGNDDIFGVLTDIQFNGPGDSQAMRTSFSESNDLNEEQEWDSGSDTRSSSSGEFIWKEGEHEESLKALKAAPQDLIENIEPAEPAEEISDEAVDDSDTSNTNSDEEAETPEFVPSAWDKFATPTKSALRSPEKVVEKSEKQKSKGVWFKKQKYHCVYEYPREPDSPILENRQLWQPFIDYNSFTEWEFDVDSYVPSQLDKNDVLLNARNHKPKKVSASSLYQLTTIPEFIPSISEEEEEELSDSAESIGLEPQPVSTTSSNSAMQKETPATDVDNPKQDNLPNNISHLNAVQTLEKLALEVVNRNKQTSDNGVLGGLRHTRDKLRLDLPPSPGAFTPSNIFTMEPTLEPVVREKPTFTTFGKSRFLVQHVDTPPSETKNKNVSFEALPCKPLTDKTIELYASTNCNSPECQRLNKEKGQKSKGYNKYYRDDDSTEDHILDSTDEDSGIESSTLERKLNEIS